MDGKNMVEEADDRSLKPPTLLTFEREDSIFSAAQVVSALPLDGPSAHYDLPSVLFVAEVLDVDIIPITWATVLGSLGRGATGKVEQAIVNAKTNFAFKRSVPAGRQSDKDRYKAIISEIRALRDPDIRTHPNIVDLNGICWDLQLEDATAWPVLIFPKAEHGSLKQFMAPENASQVSWEQRIILCRDIVAGLSCLHNQNILHGDLKPDNVVVREMDGRPQAQLIDFAFSCWAGSDDDLIWMPKTTPWTAPEHEWKEFSFYEGRKMDMFSLGMVCCFVLFRQSWSLIEDFFRTSSSLQTGEKDQSSPLLEFEMIEKLKTVLSTMQSQAEILSTDLLSSLQQFLSNDPSIRSLDLLAFSKVLEAFLPDNAIKTMKKIEAYGSQVAHYQAHGVPILHKRLQQLDRCHFAVREAIFASLKVRANSEEECTDCSFLAAIQVSFCHRIGFGTPRDVEEAEAWVRELLRRTSKADDKDRLAQIFMQQLASTHEHNNPAGPLGLEGLVADGLLDYNASDMLLASGISMNEVISKIKTEGESREAEFGEDHESTINYKLILSVLYSRAGQPELARSIVEQVRAIFEANEPEFSPNRHGMAQAILIDFLRESGDLNNAKREAEKHFELMQLSYGPDHVDVYKSLTGLASITADLGEFQSAISLQQKVVAGYESIFGKYRRDTISSISTLASMHRDKGDLQTAELLNRDALERSKQGLGADHVMVMQLRSQLAAIMYDRHQDDEVDEIEKEFRLVFTSLTTKLGASDVGTLTAGVNHSAALIRLGRLEEAEQLTKRLLSTSRIALGQSAPTTIVCMDHLATIKHEQGHPGMAQAWYLECIEVIERTKSPESKDLINVLANLALSYLESEELDVGYQYYLRSLALARKYYKPPHIILAVITSHGGSYLLKMKRYQQSIDMNVEAAAHFDSVRGSGSEGAAKCHQQIDDAKKALRLLSATQEPDVLAVITFS